MPQQKPITVNIRPTVNVYATYQRLSYRPWFAIAEFVDNSTQSYYDRRRPLLRAFKGGESPGHLRVEINYEAEDNRLTIRDNAYGMELEQLERALILNRPPPSRTGRSEFGMGLKTAACWFGRTWTIRTSQLGSARQLTARVHVPDLAKGKSEEIPIDVRPESEDAHYTLITIDGLYRPIRGRTPGRIRDQIASMYREDLRSKEIEILWNGAPVKFGEPPIHVDRHDDGSETVWKRDIAFDVAWEARGKPLSVRGWIGIRIPGSQRDAGFVLFRRQRVVVGGPGEGYRPMELFGQGNTFRYQRLIGELHLDDWPVMQAKDAFDWTGGLEDAFIEELKKACRDYVDFAETLRLPERRLSPAHVKEAAEPARRLFTDPRLSEAVAQEILLPEPPKTDEQALADAAKVRAASEGPLIFVLEVAGERWTFRLHWQDQLSDAHWMQVEYPREDQIEIFLNMAHPFFVPYLDRAPVLELIYKLVMSLALAEKLARRVSENGRIEPGEMRTYMNRVLRLASNIEVLDD